MKTGLTLKKKPCTGCVRSSHGIFCAYGVTDKCFIRIGYSVPSMYKTNRNLKKEKVFCNKIRRFIRCDCGGTIFTKDCNPNTVFTCPDCGLTDKVSKD